MTEVDWVLVRNYATSSAPEFLYAQSELRRQLPACARWLSEKEADILRADVGANAQSSLLILEHSWVTLERRCIERLARALSQGYGIAEACDSRHPAPMAVGGYATLRGMERFVDGYQFDVQTVSGESESPPALVSLTTVGAWQGRVEGHSPVARVSGAFAHDASNYFGADRADVLPMVPDFARRFLDVGGGEGNFLSLIKAARNGETHLVEFDAEVANHALRAGKADFVWTGDFLEFKTDLTFDCISFLDMLEHVVHPGRCLEHAKNLLAANGVVIASIPNIGHWSVVADLLEGRWDYVSDGIHCITHLRFFTKKTIADLFNAAGFEIQKIERVQVPAPAQWLAAWSQTSNLQVDTRSLDTYAYLVVGQLRAER